MWPAAPFGKTAALALLAGIATCLWSPALAPQPWLWSALLVGTLLWWRGRAVRWLGALAFGCALAGLHAGHALSLQLPGDWEKREVTVQGRVVELPEHQSRRTAFAFRVADTSNQPGPLRGRLLQLSWYDD